MYRATIPKQPKDTVVLFYINATDFETNSVTSNVANCTVLDLPKYYLTISVQPVEGGATTPPVGLRSYTEGENATVTITVAEGSEFDYWELDGTNAGTTTTCIVSMNTNHTLIAHVKMKTGMLIEFIVGGAIAGIVIVAIAVFFIRKRK